MWFGSTTDRPPYEARECPTPFGSPRVLDESLMRPRWSAFLDWPRPDAAQWRADLLAGATVAVVAIPQALAYAQIAGLPPHVGLYAAFVPTIVAAMFGSSAQLSTGPVALTALMTAATLSALAEPGSARYAMMAVVLAIGSGLLQFGAALARMGRLIERIPGPLMLGFVNAAAMVIAASQLPAMLGVPAPSGASLPVSTALLLTGLSGIHGVTAWFGVASLVALLGLRRLWPNGPGALIVSIVAISISALIDYERIGRVVGVLPSGLPDVVLPSFEPEMWSSLLPGMAVVALISFIEVASSARVIAARTGVAWRVNQELFGQGLAKIAAGLSQAFPVSGSFSRSALNLGQGARSPWSSIVCAAFVAAALVFAGEALRHLPLAVLSALIVSAVVSLISPRELLFSWRTSKWDGAIAWGTLVATLLSAPRIHYGLAVGFAFVAMRAVVGSRTDRITPMR